MIVLGWKISGSLPTSYVLRRRSVAATGWHIECSVMATDINGEYLDIHAGGCLDLKEYVTTYYVCVYIYIHIHMFLFRLDAIEWCCISKIMSPGYCESGFSHHGAKVKTSSSRSSAGTL